MNKFEFLGRLTKDPEVRYTSGNNTQVTTFTIAVNRRFVAQGAERQSDFFNLTSFGKTAEFCSKYFKKGQQVLVVGRIQNRSWDDAQTGQKRYATDFIVEETYFADSKKDGAGSYDMPVPPMPASTDAGDFITVDETEELPF